jgi:hypothetical protein
MVMVGLHTRRMSASTHSFMGSLAELRGLILHFYNVFKVGEGDSEPLAAKDFAPELAPHRRCQRCHIVLSQIGPLEFRASA